jgi:glycosyltransferase involved in cell wall biosynthesis
MAPLVSILIPAYNAERWIADTIKSALAQTWPDKEVIIVDDGSRDKTVNIARRFASKNVAVVTQENQGAPAARNNAFARCQGDYVQWLDADDLLAPDKITRQMGVVEQAADKRALISGAFGTFRYRVSKAKFNPTPLWCDLTPLEWILRKWERNDYMQTATWLVSRELTEAAGPWDGRLMGDDDGEYFCRVLLASSGTRFVHEAKMFYRIVGAGRWSHVGRSKKKIDAQLLSMLLQTTYVRSSLDNERVRAACLNYLQAWFFFFYPEQTDAVVQLQELARSLAGQLHPPRLTWKYIWIQKLVGWSAAKRIRIDYNRCKSSLLRALDKALFYLESRGHRQKSQSLRDHRAQGLVHENE